MASPYLDAVDPDARRALVDSLLERQSGRCFLCDQPVDSTDPGAVLVDLVQPAASGGADDPSNYAALHTGCGRSRQHADLEIARALALFGRTREAPADGPSGASLRSAAPTPRDASAPLDPQAGGPPEGDPDEDVGATQEQAIHADPVDARSTAAGTPADEPAASGPSFGRALGLIVVGAVLPGVCFLAAGRRWLGLAVLALTAVVVTMLVFALGDPRSTAVEFASRPRLVLTVGIGVLVLAVLWIAVILVGHRMVLPRTANRSQRWTAAGLAVVLSTAVLLPALLVTRYAFATKDLIDTVFEASTTDGDTPLTSAPIDRDDPWKDTPRLNVLLLGGDSERSNATVSGGGFLTTTLIVASIDTDTGDSLLVSLPPELQRAPIPAGNPLSSLYPAGYTCTPDPGACLLNGVYREAEAHADLFPEEADPGLDTVRDVVSEITGVPLDYHLFVDLEGFASLVDALGGVDVNVGPKPVPVIGLGGPSTASGQPAIQTIPAGRQHLDGLQAVAFARERPGSDPASVADDRVRRQSDVLGAVLAAADPSAVVTNYLVLSTAAKDTLSTDVPIELLPALVDLAELVRAQPLAVVPLPRAAVTPTAPDYGQIRAAVTDALGTTPGSTG